MSPNTTNIRQRRGEDKPSIPAPELDHDSKAQDGEYDFGGPIGASAMMIGFPMLMYYMWVGAKVYDGHLPLPAEGQSLPQFAIHLCCLTYEHAYPHTKAWVTYWSFMILEAFGYVYLPGVYGKGKYLPHLGKQLTYYCSAVWSWYITIAVSLVLHVTGLFRLTIWIEEFGPIMSVAIISGFLIPLVAYLSALARGAGHRMSGNHVYDYFMGAELNPRLFGWLDFKMFLEARIPWFIMFLVSLGAAAVQYENYGYVSKELAFVLLAHFFYANACAKGEELIITSWDIYYEKWGFMLAFWTMAGVPFTYCHSAIYLALHHPSEYQFNGTALAVLHVAHLLVYWAWDTGNSQKNMFRAQGRGVAVVRKTFPQLPWKFVKNPKIIKTNTGDDILCDGWYGLARKIHYTCDMLFAVSWSLVTGFNSPFPWVHPLFFFFMLTHRAHRDIRRCRARYGEAWEEYERRVPYLFIPYVI
ncbi:Delta(24(24(1)))-sterol reductase [Plectosphaerella plurivora]|uniref:Delta(24(24(1)))-sterol reductase n=1 Tax=Plectosphaerella plurivora TaxID=936078 RepID=A0A9P8V088_9PEZI|nr:Delta(24(24(1)))-sterol reductase [Plectosphaerella plurivora]